MTREKPYTTNQETWNSILQKNLSIPMNQREYSWQTDEIERFLDDIFKIFEEKKYIEKMGSIINLNYNNENYIYDGQQRILTTILILNVIGSLSKKVKNKILPLLTVDTEIDKLTEQQEKIKVKCKVNIIPKIYCINPNDMEGLVNIFNGKVESWISHLENINDLELKSIKDLSDLEEYLTPCGIRINRKSDFIRHITNKYKYIEPKKNTKLNSAFIDIYNYFVVIKKYSDQELVDLFKFIINDIDVQYYDCSDPEYVSRIFDWENNRGRAVETLDIIKNPVLVQIPDDKKVEIYERWELLKHKENKVYKINFGQKIFDIAIQIYNNKITRTLDLEKLFNPIIYHNNTYQEINKFFQIVERLFSIMDEISNDKFGKLLNNTPRVCLNWDAYMYCLLPIFYKINYIDTKLIKLMTKWYFRNLQFNNRTFNNLCYSNEFIIITNKVLNNKDYNYYNEIEERLKLYKHESINKDNYCRSMSNMNFKSTNATHLLLFLESCISTDLQTVSLEYTLEHIFCQKDKPKLCDQSLMNNIGNLTIIEGKNSINGHKGNSSLGSKAYKKKVLSYKDSSSKITREIAQKFETFSEDSIKDRNIEIVNLLDKYTNY